MEQDQPYTFPANNALTTNLNGHKKTVEVEQSEENPLTRDFATLEEKDAWNKTRGIFYDAHKPLQRLDNSLSQQRANEEI